MGRVKTLRQPSQMVLISSGWLKLASRASIGHLYCRFAMKPGNYYRSSLLTPLALRTATSDRGALNNLNALNEEPLLYFFSHFARGFFLANRFFLARSFFQDFSSGFFCLRFKLFL